MRVLISSRIALPGPLPAPSALREGLAYDLPPRTRLKGRWCGFHNTHAWASTPTCHRGSPLLESGCRCRSSRDPLDRCSRHRLDRTRRGLAAGRGPSPSPGTGFPASWPIVSDLDPNRSSDRAGANLGDHRDLDRGRRRPLFEIMLACLPACTFS